MPQRLMVFLRQAATLSLAAAVTPRWISAETYTRMQVILPDE